MDIRNQFLTLLHGHIQNHFRDFQFVQRREWNLLYEDADVMETILFGGDLGTVYKDGQAIPIWGGSISCTRKLKSIERFWEDLIPKINFQMNNYYTISSTSFEKSRDKDLSRYEIPKTGSLTKDESLINRRLIQRYHYTLFPILEHQSDIHYLHQHYNDPIETKGHKGKGWFLKLIIAKLAGAENYAQIRDFVYGFFSDLIADPQYTSLIDRHKNWLEALKTVDRRLQSVEPLKDPYLGSPKRRQMEEEWRALNR